MKKDNSCQSCKKDLGEEYSYSWGNFTKLCESCYCVAFWGSVRQPAAVIRREHRPPADFKGTSIEFKGHIPPFYD